MTKTLIIIHIIFGSLALLSGSLVIVLKKGNLLHKRIGRVYFFSGILGTVLSMIVACSPNHYNLFLFLIGVLTLYFLIGGFYAFNINKNGLKLLSLIMVIVSLVMIGYALFLFWSVKIVSGIILLFFGLIGIANSYIVDYRIYIKGGGDSLAGNHKMSLHIGKMVGSYIAMSTAFVVVNNIFYFRILNWILPAIIGGFLIRHYIKNGRKK